MSRVYVSRGLPEPGLELLRAAGAEVTVGEGRGPEELLAAPHCVNPEVYETLAYRERG